MTPRDLHIKLSKLQESNGEKMRSLIRAKQHPDPILVMMLRLDTLINVIMTEEQKEIFELAFETDLEEFLDDLKQRTSGLIVPGR